MLQLFVCTDKVLLWLYDCTQRCGKYSITHFNSSSSKVVYVHCLWVVTDYKKIKKKKRCFYNRGKGSLTVCLTSLGWFGSNFAISSLMLAKVGRRVGSRLQHIFIIVYLKEVKSLDGYRFAYYLLFISQNFINALKLTFLEGRNLVVACDNHL